MVVIMESHKQGKILVVDDEQDILELLKYRLSREGYSVSCLDSGEEAVRTARRDRPDLVVLDLMLPGFDGLEVCKIMKNDPATRDIPIIMLTAKGEESDVIVGLELGADDYVTKPFSSRVLAARIKAVLKRRKKSDSPEETAVVQHSGISIFPERHEVTIEGRPIDLTATEFRILELLARHPGRVFSRYQIVDAVRGEDYPVTERSVDVHITSLRKKLGKYSKTVDTVRGVGYRFKEPGTS
jgi:two-component system alkaline phosphatase synthesis response regulator PhoP